MLIAVVVTAITVLGVHIWRRRGRRGGAELDQCGSRVEAVNRTSVEESMEYNPMYRPQNPQESKQHSDVDIIHTGHMMQSHTHTHTHTHTHSYSHM